MTHRHRPRTVQVLAPAKLNLGLEILGRRDDGYHEIVTILQAIDLVDDLRLRAGEGIRPLRPLPGVRDDENLALRALDLLRRRSGTERGAWLDLRKAIPTAAGLGGASSDAAAALLAARDLWALEMSDEALAALAAELGSDVPFFLGGGTALASGRGEVLESLPSPGVWAVVVTPRLTIERKTATLYGAIRASDYSDGSRVLAQAERLRGGLPPDPTLLANAFEQPLLGLRPDLAELAATMRACGAPHVALSGAGPSHYALFAGPDEAVAVARRLEAALGDSARVVATRDRSAPVGTRISNS